MPEPDNQPLSPGIQIMADLTKALCLNNDLLERLGAAIEMANAAQAELIDSVDRLADQHEVLIGTVFLMKESKHRPDWATFLDAFEQAYEKVFNDDDDDGEEGGGGDENGPPRTPFITGDPERRTRAHLH